MGIFSQKKHLNICGIAWEWYRW